VLSVVWLVRATDPASKEEDGGPAHPARPAALVTLGVDTHAETHVAAALDQAGRLLGTRTVPTTPAGYAALLAWASTLGVWTGSAWRAPAAPAPGSPAGCALTAKPSWRSTGPTGPPDGARARPTPWTPTRPPERCRPVRPRGPQGRRRPGGDDPLAAPGAPLGGQGPHAGRQPAQRAAGDRARWLRAQLRGLPLAKLVATAARLRPDQVPATPTDAAKFALWSVAGRWLRLTEEITELDLQLGRLVATAAPALVAVQGVGTQTAAVLLVAAGDNPERLRSEGAFAHLCGVAPIPVSSGKTTRHRLSRGGNRQANSALYLIAVGRMAWHPPTRAYVKRRTKQGKTKAEIIRCLKRYIARELYAVLTGPAG
jgi:transposase